LSDEGEPVALFCRTPAGYLVRFPDFADFAIETSGWTVVCTPVPETDQDWIDHLFRNQIAPLIAGSKGEMVLHASSVAGPEGALAFAGPTGRGKSTLAAAFAHAGFGFVSDDGLILANAGPAMLAMPGRPLFRLRRDSEEAFTGRLLSGTLDPGGDKRPVASGPALPYHPDPVPLAAIFLLSDNAVPCAAIDRLTPAAALSDLLRHSFILDVEDKPRLHQKFERLAQLAESIPCFALAYPRRYDALPQVIEAILGHPLTGAGTA
jgi:hypothetical protein